MRRCAWLLGLLSSLLLSPAIMRADNLVYVPGANSSVVVLTGTSPSTEYGAMSFSTGASGFTNVSIAPYFSTGTFGSGHITGNAYLTTAIGPSATAGDVVASSPFDVTLTDDANLSTYYLNEDEPVMLNGVTLAANTTYYFVVAVDNGGTANWDNAFSGSTSSGVTLGASYIADGGTGLDTTNPYASTFSGPRSEFGASVYFPLCVAVNDGNTNCLPATQTTTGGGPGTGGGTSTVPEPSSLVLIASGMFGVVTRMRRRK